MKRLLFLAILLAGSAVGRADEVPLPRPRPLALSTVKANLTPYVRWPDVARSSLPGSIAPPEVATPERTDAGGPPPSAKPSFCQIALTEIAAFRPLPQLEGPGECGAPDVVELEAIVLPNNVRVAMTPPATLRCSMAEAVAQWVRDELAANASSLGSPLRSIANYDSYDCRGRNRVAGAKLSEHGRANALDIRALMLADGRKVELTDASMPREFRDGLRKSACARFMTVLGPGSDGYHESHVHVDLAERRGNFHICQWDVREPLALAEVPIPRPRPAVAAQTLPEEEEN